MRWLIGSVFLLWLAGCAPKNTGEENASKLDDALISFNVNAQAGRYGDALEFVTRDEQVLMLEPNGSVKEEYRQAMSRLKLSALRAQNFTLDRDGKLVGMQDVLLEANRKFQVSEEQRKVGIGIIAGPMERSSSSSDAENEEALSSSSAEAITDSSAAAEEIPADSPAPEDAPDAFDSEPAD